MRANRLRTGPMAHRMMVTTIRENRAPIRARPATRMARRMSRKIRAVKALIPAPFSVRADCPGRSGRATLRRSYLRLQDARASVRRDAPAIVRRVPRSARQVARADAAWRRAARATDVVVARPTGSRLASRRAAQDPLLLARLRSPRRRRQGTVTRNSGFRER